MMRARTAALPVQHVRVRLNVTSEGVLVAFNTLGAIVRLPTAQAPGRQTTLAIERFGGDTVHLAARVVRSTAHTSAPAEHYVTLQFLGLPDGAAAQVERILDDAVAISVPTAEGADRRRVA